MKMLPDKSMPTSTNHAQLQTWCQQYS